MKPAEQIKQFIKSLEEPKRSEIQALHELTLQAQPGCKLWFDTGKDSNNKTVTNPTIGYGFQVLNYANGKTREFFQIGISATSTGISVYILGLKDKTYLAKTFGKTLGKAKVTGYCISFKSVKDLDLAVLKQAISYGLKPQQE